MHSGSQKKRARPRSMKLKCPRERETQEESDQKWLEMTAKTRFSYCCGHTWVDVGGSPNEKNQADGCESSGAIPMSLAFSVSELNPLKGSKIRFLYQRYTIAGPQEVIPSIIVLWVSRDLLLSVWSITTSNTYGFGLKSSFLTLWKDSSRERRKLETWGKRTKIRNHLPDFPHWENL